MAAQARSLTYYAGRGIVAVRLLTRIGRDLREGDARRDERWFAFFEHQFDVLWTSARPAGESDGYGPAAAHGG